MLTNWTVAKENLQKLTLFMYVLYNDKIYKFVKM